MADHQNRDGDSFYAGFKCRACHLGSLVGRATLPDWWCDLDAGAATVKLAGFDMCMIHAGHGWLLAQFLSLLINKRTDKYGGTIQSWATFPLMVIDRVRERVGKGFPIELRIGGSGLAQDRYTLEDATTLAQMAEHKVDLIHAD